jgi:hypothetical protein
MASDIIANIRGHKWAGGSDAGKDAAAADLIGTMATELAHIARRHGFDALSFLLDMARLEADNLSQSSKDVGARN